MNFATFATFATFAGRAARWSGLWLACASQAACAAPTGAELEAQTRLRTRSLAATCTHCHGTDGRAVEGEANVKLAGLPADYTLTQLMAFRSGARPATIMHQLAKGYTSEQLAAIAAYFAAQK